jgi:hypothetical protein
MYRFEPVCSKREVARRKPADPRLKTKVLKELAL